MEKVRKTMLIIISVTVIVIGIIIIAILANSILNKKKYREFIQTHETNYTIAELNAINNKFLKYEGRQKGSTIKALFQDIKIHNENLKEREKSVILEGGEGINNIKVNGIQTIETSSIKYTKSYIVTIEEYYENGQVKKIHIEEVQEENNNL